MAWTAPMTATSNQTFTAAQWNTHVRDNFLETEVAKATANRGFFVSTAANAIGQYHLLNSYKTLSAPETTTSSSYTDLKTYGPTLTTTTGTSAIVFISCEMGNSTNDALAAADFDVSGATTRAATDTTMVAADGLTASNDVRRSAATRITLTAGSNTFTMKYRQSGGTGRFWRRHISVWPI